MRLIEQVADARTPADALRLLRDWLEGKGEHVAGALLHEETFLELGYFGCTEWKAVEKRANERYDDAIADFEKEARQDYEDGKDAGYDEGYDKGWKEGYAEGKAEYAPLEELEEEIV